MPRLGVILLVTVVLSALVGFMLVLYMSYIAIKDLEKFEVHLSRSRLIISNRVLMGDGFIGRVYRLLQISSCLILKDFSISKGHLDPEDAKEFPVALARKVIWPGRFIIVAFCIVVLVGAYGKYFNGYKA